MKVETIKTGAMGVNTYIVWSEGDESCIVIDPGGYSDKFKEIFNENGIKPEYILLTHGHFDHIGGIERLKQEYNSKIIIHALDKSMLLDPAKNLSCIVGLDFVQPEADELLFDGAVVQTGKTKFKVLHTPGHSPGGISLYGDGIAFTGDTLVKKSVGRTDFADCNFNDLLKSIHDKLMVLPDDTVIYPGHGPASTIGFEKQNNNYLKLKVRR